MNVNGIHPTRHVTFGVQCEWYTSYTTCNVWGTKPEDCPEAYVETKGVVCNEMGEVTSIILCKFCVVVFLFFPMLPLINTSTLS